MTKTTQKSYRPFSSVVLGIAALGVSFAVAVACQPDASWTTSTEAASEQVSGSCEGSGAKITLSVDGTLEVTEDEIEKMIDLFDAIRKYYNWWFGWGFSDDRSRDEAYNAGAGHLEDAIYDLVKRHKVKPLNVTIGDLIACNLIDKTYLLNHIRKIAIAFCTQTLPPSEVHKGFPNEENRREVAEAAVKILKPYAYTAVEQYLTGLANQKGNHLNDFVKNLRCRAGEWVSGLQGFLAGCIGADAGSGQ